MTECVNVFFFYLVGLLSFFNLGLNRFISLTKKQQQMILEACVGNLSDAISAERLGAHQIELCDRLDLDGTSPSFSTIKQTCDQLIIPIKVIVNPNPFNYNYSQKDIKNILAYIKGLNNLPVRGIVFGPLTHSGLPDLHTLSIIADNTDLPITYHKAIDTTEDILRSTSMLIEQDIVKFILSSGGKKNASEGIEPLKKMQTLLKDSTIQLIAAGSITKDNLAQLHKSLNLVYYHGKKIVGNLD